VKKTLHRRARHAATGAIRVHPKEFVFLDRVTGEARFCVKAAPDGSLPVEETSSLLAVHCLLHSQEVSDFRIVLSVGDNLMHLVSSRAHKLIKSCAPELIPIQISLRQQQVLRGIFQNLRNKEIAAGMHVAERTVKFHVSALLQKFKVADRATLVQKVGDLMASQGATSRLLHRDVAESPAPGDAPGATPMQPALIRMVAGERRAGR
jgi:DNA-binding CsgD family transcriptional regulator